jgi:hypothetical protein
VSIWRCCYQGAITLGLEGLDEFIYLEKGEKSWKRQWRREERGRGEGGVSVNNG